MSLMKLFLAGNTSALGGLHFLVAGIVLPEKGFPRRQERNIPGKPELPEVFPKRRNMEQSVKSRISGLGRITYSHF
jgi:hypothetical protein